MLVFWFKKCRTSTVIMFLYGLVPVLTSGGTPCVDEQSIVKLELKFTVPPNVAFPSTGSLVKLPLLGTGQVAATKKGCKYYMYIKVKDSIH